MSEPISLRDLCPPDLYPDTISILRTLFHGVAPEDWATTHYLAGCYDLTIASVASFLGQAAMHPPLSTLERRRNTMGETEWRWRIGR